MQLVDLLHKIYECINGKQLVYITPLTYGNRYVVSMFLAETEAQEFSQNYILEYNNGLIETFHNKNNFYNLL